MHTRSIGSYVSRAAVAVGVILLVNAVSAQDVERPPTHGPTIRANVGDVLNRAIESLNAKKYADAESAIAALDRSALTPFERSRVAQIRFNIAFNDKRYDDAIVDLQEAIDAGGLSAAEVSRARYQTAQLLMTKGEWGEGAAALEQWVSSAANPDGNAYYLLAVAYYQKGDYAHALPAVEQAVTLTEEPPESWMQLLLALHLKREDYADAIVLLQRLIALVPQKKKYWMQLSSVYGRTDDYRNALAIMQLAYNAGFVTEDAEIRRFADLLLFNNVPARAAKVLETAVASKSVTLDDKLYEKLADSFIAADELDKAVAPLTRAAELSADGQLFVRLGELQVRREDWARAEAALESGFAKGKLEDSGRADYLMGVVVFEQGRLQAARSWFELALRSDKWRESAARYLGTIDGRLGSRHVL